MVEAKLLCDHEGADETALHDGSNGLPVRHCHECDSYFTDEDVTHDNMMYAASFAGVEDSGWPKRYTDCLSELGFAIVPWPESMTMPHSAMSAHPRVARSSADVDMIVIDGDVFRAMARALEGAI
jgi:hypothetical protein